MADEVLLIVQFDLFEGKLEELRGIYQQGIDTIKEKEPDVLYFQLYVSPDEKAVCSVEVYRDSPAVLKHFALSSERIPKVLETCRVTNVGVYGPVSDEVKELLDPYNTKYYNFSIGYSGKE